jgi:succinate dehydrogenase / fumarate reductase membrane anchor subunit
MAYPPGFSMGGYNMRPRYVPQRGVNLDYLMWLFTRISGVGIVTLAIIGLGAAMYMGARLHMDLPTVLRWTFFPNSNHVVNSNIPDVTLGWANAFWQIVQFLIVFLAFTHAANGIRMIVEDYITHSFWQPFLRAFIVLLWAGMVFLAIYVIIGSAY